MSESQKRLLKRSKEALLRIIQAVHETFMLDVLERSILPLTEAIFEVELEQEKKQACKSAVVCAGSRLRGCANEFRRRVEEGSYEHSSLTQAIEEWDQAVRESTRG